MSRNTTIRSAASCAKDYGSIPPNGRVEIAPTADFRWRTVGAKRLRQQRANA
jgi:hypothetical protein